MHLNTYTIDGIDCCLLSETLKENVKYFVKFSDKNADLLEAFVYNIVNYHLTDRNFVLNKLTHSVEVSLCSDLNLSNEFDKKTKDSPIFTILVFLSDDNPILFTTIDTESYKYKEIPDKNNLFVVVSKKNNHVIFDGSKYYGKLLSEPCKILKINIWDKQLNDRIEYSAMDIFQVNNAFNISLTDLRPFEKTIIDNNIMETVLYDKSSDRVSKLKTITDLIVNNKNISTFEITVKKTNFNDINEESLEDKFGAISKDIMTFYKKDISMNNDNRFNNNKLVQNLLSLDTCYWIIDEAEKKKWSDSPYPNYHEYMNIENLPSVMNYVLYVSRFWLVQVRKLYDMDNININIKDIFIAKYNKHMSGANKFSDDTFLTLNIQLNDDVDYIGGEILIDEDSIKLKQGDLLVHNGKKLRTSGRVSDGIKYMLVLFTDIVF